MRLEVVDPVKLEPHPEYLRLFLPVEREELAALQEAMAAGQRFPPLLITPQDQIIAGVEHWMAALGLGWREISAFRCPALRWGELRALMVAENIRQRDMREEHLGRAMNNFFDMEPLRPAGGW